MELQDLLLREEFASLIQAVACLQALELVNKPSRGRNRKTLHLEGVREDEPVHVTEANCGGQGSKGQIALVGTARVPVDTQWVLTRGSTKW